MPASMVRRCLKFQRRNSKNERKRLTVPFSFEKEEKLRLDELAIIRTGLVTARKQAKYDSEIVAEYQLLNLKAINAKGYIEEGSLEKLSATERLKADYLTQPKDVIVRLTYPYTAVIIEESQAGWLIPSHFVIIRCCENKILPEYLYWLLNTEKVKNELQQNVSSAMIGNVKPKSYADLDIELLLLEEQRRIAELHMLAQKELRLLDRIIVQKEAYYSCAIEKIQKGMRKKHENN